MSEHQRAIYYFWNGRTIKARGRTFLLRSFLKDSKAEDKRDVLIEELKDNFYIAKCVKWKIVSVTRITSELPTYAEVHNLNLIKTKYILVRKEGENYSPVISNTTKVGKPKIYNIKGQDIYNGILKEFQRGFVMDSIKACYLPYVKDMPIITTYPCKIECEIYDTIKNPLDKSKDELGVRWDVDNLAYPYLKAFPDLLVSLGKLRDDDRLHLPSNIGARFIPIDNHEDRKLVFTINSDDTYKKYNNHKAAIRFLNEQIKENGEENIIF